MMKRLFFIAIGFSISLLCACVQTPDESFVPQKDITQMIEMARATPDLSVSTDTIEQLDSPETTQRYDHIILSFPGKMSDSFRIEVDADVTMPKSALPIIRVIADDFDENTVNRYYTVLTENFDMYTPDQLNTRSVLDQKIQRAMDEIANGNDEQPVKDYLNMLIEKRKGAKEETGNPVKHFSLSQNECLYSIDEKQVFGVYPNAVYDNGQVGKEAYLFFRNLDVCKDNAVEYRVFFGEAQHITGLSDISMYPTEIHMTPSDADMYARTLLDNLGLSNFAVSGLFVSKEENDEAVYIAICDRSINGIPVAHPGFNSGSSADANIPVWGYEQVIICFNDKGLAYFGYKAPLSMEDIVVEKSNLLPFDRIMERFQNMITTMYEVWVTDPSWGITDMTIHVTNITLTLQRINEQDNIDYGLLIPVWNFWGYTVQKSIYEEKIQEESHIDGWYGSKPILTINAINGDVINPENGY